MGARTAPAEPGPTLPPLARARRRERQSDLVMIIVCAAIVVASIVLTPSDSVVTLFGWELPGLCVFKNLTGMDCPGCGLTRSFTFMGHGDLRRAFDLHWLGPFLYALVAAQIPYRAWRIWMNRPGGPGVGPLRDDADAGRPTQARG